MRKSISKISHKYFSGCNGCVKCCDGSKFILAPLILEDFHKVKDFFEIRAIVLDEIIPVMLFNDGNSPCKYLKNNQCSIYLQRPPACKIYPFSPYYDDILLDLECDAINDSIGLKLPSTKKEFLDSIFFEERMINFKQKRQQTIDYMKNKKLYFDKEIKGIKLYKFKE